MQNRHKTIVVIGTGGTIAGTAASAADHTGYTAAQINVAQLLAAVPTLSGQPLEVLQLAQVDSKDMDFGVWRALALAVDQAVARPEVAGVVITHGTDTLEETAWFLQAVLAPAKPVVLTAAMRPSTALSADGPQNLADAVAVAAWPQARGVVAVLAGRVHGAADVRKAHTYRVDAFDSGDAGPVALVEEGRLRILRPWPQGPATGVQSLLALEPTAWPWVEIVTSGAGAQARAVQALVRAGVRGLVVAGTGNGTIHSALESALTEAQGQGVTVWRASRCGMGPVLGDHPRGWPSAGSFTPAKARVALMLELMRA
ncbi:MAG: asparaginase [Caldimonas sp.]|uniref:asparaginase n=1 Tax=Caldimonas sp. TaxID=2838790 RepID=UPI00391A8954